MSEVTAREKALAFEWLRHYALIHNSRHAMTLLDEIMAGHPSTGLSFNLLREANLKRLPEFRNAKGEPSHAQPDGSDWSLNDWCTAVAGELGEAANILKKVRRGDMTMAEARPLLADELADVQTYLDLLAYRADIDLGAATINKWNAVSMRIGTNLRIVGGLLKRPDA